MPLAGNFAVATKGRGQSTTARMLGLYLVIAGVSQVAILGAVGLQMLAVPFFLMPRIGWMYLLDNLNLGGTYSVWFPEVFSGSWLVFFGALLLRGKHPLKTYIASEIFLAFPTLRLVSGLLVSGGGHVLVRTDGFKMLLESLVFTFVPVGLAIWTLKQRSSSKAT